MRSFLTGLAGIVIGFAAHEAWEPSYAAAPVVLTPILRSGALPADAVARGGPPAGAAHEADWQRLHAETPSASREERQPPAPAPMPPGGGAAGASAAAEPPTVTEQQQHALDAQARLLDQAIEAGVWTDQDVEMMRILLPRISPEQRQDAFTAVSRAINQGQLELEAKHPF